VTRTASAELETPTGVGCSDLLGITKLISKVCTFASCAASAAHSFKAEPAEVSVLPKAIGAGFKRRRFPVKKDSPMGTRGNSCRLDNDTSHMHKVTAPNKQRDCADSDEEKAHDA